MSVVPAQSNEPDEDAVQRPTFNDARQVARLGVQARREQTLAIFNQYRQELKPKHAEQKYMVRNTVK